MIQAFALVLATSFAAPSPHVSAMLEPGTSYRHICHSPESSCPHGLVSPTANAPIKGSASVIKKVRTIKIRVPKAS